MYKNKICCSVKNIIKIGCSLIIMVFMFSACIFPEEPDKNCNQELNITKNFSPHEIWLYHDGKPGSNNTVKDFWVTLPVDHICPEEFLLVTCKIKTKSDQAYEDIKSIKLFWHYRPWITHYKDYVYVLVDPDNHTQWAVAYLLLPVDMGFPLEYPAEIDFSVNIYLWDALQQDDGAAWPDDNISSIEIEVEGTRF